MEGTDRPILATLTYYGILQWPLTLSELSERLIPDTRFHRGSSPQPRPSLRELALRMEALVASGVVKTMFGMYGTPDMTEEVFWGRAQKEKEHAQKWRRVRRFAWFLQGLPYIRALFGSGSMALGNTGVSSDWDVFVVARTGRLYTARAFLLATTFLMRRLRVKRDLIAPDKFCFNHYITEDHLALQHRSLFTAHIFSWLVPLYDPENFLERFRTANAWTGDFISGHAGNRFVYRNVRTSRTLAVLRNAIEGILNTSFGDLLERGLQRWQRGRILREPATHAPGGRVLAGDFELEFHPRSAERNVLTQYNAALRALGIAHSEPDSGLTK